MVNLDDFEPKARALLPRRVYDYFAGGAEDEATLEANREAFRRWRFEFKVLASADEPRLSTTVLGQPVSMPIQLAPTATQCMAHPQGELAAARAASTAGVIYCLSTLSTVSLEEVAQAGGPRWFQLYVYRDRSITRELVERAGAAGYSAIVVTVDTPLLGRRERDFRNAFALPSDMHYANLEGALSRTGSGRVGQSELARYFNDLLDHGLSFKDLEWLASITRLPVLVKGVVRPDDAVRCVDHGAAGIIVSNHGGRQLDYSVASLDALPGVVEAVRGRNVPVLVDGGVRRGTDVIKALCLGASSVLIGRPYLWGLAVGGQEGVASVLQLLRDELAISLSLLGAKGVHELSRDFLAEA
jgi:4-hydroxymandelate oxidase